MSRVPTMLLAAEFWPGATGAGLAEGFRDAGWAVQEVDQGYYEGARANLPLRVAARVARPMAIRAYRARLVQECQLLQPDVFLTIKGVGITEEVIASVRGTGAKVVMFYPDVLFDHLNVDKNTFRHYDLFVTSKSFHKAYLEERIGVGKVSYVPHGYVRSVHRPLYNGSTEFIWDVLYVGGHTPHKQRWLEQLAMAMPEINLAVFGWGWQHISKSNVLGKYVRAGSYHNLSYADILQRARINIAVHCGPIGEFGWEDQVSTRTFEIPACRAFMLHVGNEEVGTFFDPHTEVATFSSVGELKEKIKFYLANPDTRSEMVAAAYSRCVPNYSYNVRALRILELIKQHT